MAGEIGLVVNDFGAIIKEEPDSWSKALGTINPFETVDILDESHKVFTKIRHGLIEGYIPSKYLAKND